MATQRALNYLVRENITVRLTSCLTDLDLAERVNLLLMKHKQFKLPRQTGGQPYSDSFPFPLQSK